MVLTVPGLVQKLKAEYPHLSVDLLTDTVNYIFAWIEEAIFRYGHFRIYDFGDFWYLFRGSGDRIKFVPHGRLNFLTLLNDEAAGKKLVDKQPKWTRNAIFVPEHLKQKGQEILEEFSDRSQHPRLLFTTTALSGEGLHDALRRLLEEEP